MIYNSEITNSSNLGTCVNSPLPNSEDIVLTPQIMKEIVTYLFMKYLINRHLVLLV